MTYTKNFFQKTSLVAMLFAIGFMMAAPTISAHEGPIPDTALLPELQAIVPDGLQVVHKQQSDTLRFTNGIANTGNGHWQMQKVADRPT